jgi:hypothetical protein
MSKDCFYFPHDYDPTGDPKMQALIGEYGAAGYGIYWRIIEMLHSDSSHKLPLKKYIYTAIAKQMLTSVEQISTIIEYCINVCELFNSDSEFITSNRVNRNIERRTQLSEKRSIAGKASAIAQQVSTKGNKGKERKGNKRIQDITEMLLFWDTYHQITGMTKTDKEASFKYWIKLSVADQQKAIDNIKPYFESLNDKKYCKKARTYLADKNFNDEFKPALIKKTEQIYNNPEILGKNIPKLDWKEPQRTSNAERY